ncbi:MAG: ATP-dependent Clp protease proteolytic subunit [Verrucomicrobiales bacterium]|nr:ATP-dependent Clp protease proteolytic subunit [Verrucomicrobiales bacterium]
MKRSFVSRLFYLCFLLAFWPGRGEAILESAKVYVLPIRDDVAPPMVYVVRRGVKEAMEARADLLVLDMETNGGRVDVTEEIIEILNKFKGQTVTYVNRKAFSAGAFIAVATQKIFMAPQSVIGAAAPMLMIPGGGPTEMPQTVEAKMTSGVRALVRVNAEKNGYNIDVVEAMIDKTKHLEIDGEVLNEKGQILTLTNIQAEKKYGEPAKPLLSSGTMENLGELLPALGFGDAQRVDVKPTGVEKIAAWINAISPLLLIIGAIGIYIEFKTPGFGLPGIVGIVALVVYFFGGYIAGLSGMEWAALFVVGLILAALEFFVFPGTTLLGFAGAVCMLVSIIMAMVDIYPSAPGLPTPMRFSVPVDKIVSTLTVALFGSFAAAWALSRVLPKTPVYHNLISQSASGEGSVAVQEQQQSKQIGELGTTTSVLRPGGKARFGDQIIDVISLGEMIPKGSRVKVIGHSGREAIVEAVPS